MCTIQKARQVLVDAEGSLRRLMKEGIGQQRYADVGRIAALAEGVSKLLAGAPGRQEFARPPSSALSRPNKKRTAPRAKAAAKKPDYPRFERTGDKLIKVGWSKKNKEEYEHRAPRQAVIAIARHLTGHATPGEVFEVLDILPVSDGDGRDVPEYQVYLTIGWLRSVGAVDRKGRDGYVVQDGTLAGPNLDELWNQLPSPAR